MFKPGMLLLYIGLSIIFLGFFNIFGFAKLGCSLMLCLVLNNLMLTFQISISNNLINKVVDFFCVFIIVAGPYILQMYNMNFTNYEKSVSTINAGLVMILISRK